MRTSAAARRYARALFGLAEDEGRVGEVRRELDALAKLLADHAELRDAIFRPLHPGAERRGVLTAVCEQLECSDTVRRFCAFLVDQRRAVDFDAIHLAYGELADLAAGRTRARVVSATELDEGQKERLRRALAARTGQEVEIRPEDEMVDERLIGGVIASVGGLVFDGSLRTQLEQLRTSLTRGQ